MHSQEIIHKIKDNKIQELIKELEILKNVYFFNNKALTYNILFYYFNYRNMKKKKKKFYN